MTQQQTIETKLESFEQAILAKANAEREQILADTEQLKHNELEKEENRLLEELYHKIQKQISAIQTANIKEISRETLALKKQLYQRREQYLGEVLEAARKRLADFAASGSYDAFFEKRVKMLAQDFFYPGSEIRVRTADLRFSNLIKEIYGDCTITADDENITLGGPILYNLARGIEADLSLDAALAEQKDWFYSHSNFNFA
ncbi:MULTISPECIES: V-type ATP synthase subunit E [Anaerotruncus]|uniref:V-type ATP synthase subunit E n=1 Tax=Anaerotruncus TaxID=244127 RepID=UPI00083069C1|nr:MULTISPECIES: V-type ATP synthase subunit E family protein [Anaerotruncus]RGX55664.1 hypothetical protein DWV16_07860 [Anaerotruncus sp. AF02-27]